MTPHKVSCTRRRRGSALLVALALAASGLGVSALAPGASAAGAGATPVRTTPVNEIAPAAAGPWFAWARSTKASPYAFDYYVRKGSGPRIRVNPPGTDSRGGGLDRRTAVYTLDWVDDSDIYAFDLRTRRRSRLPDVVNTPASEYAPTVSGRWVLFARMTYPRSRIILFDRRAGTLRVVASRSYELWPGQVNGAYATWEGRRQFRFHIPSGSNDVLPVRDGTYQRSPAVSADGTAYVCRVPRDGRRQAVVSHPVGKPARVVHILPAGRGCGDLFVKDRADGAQVVFFTSFPEESGGIEGSDVYKVVDRLVSAP
jgi:hypothetical protein